MPPSPRYVMGKHGFDAGYEALSQLRSTDPIEEAQAMWKNIEVEKDIVPVTYKEAFTAPNLSTRVWCGIIINMLQQTSGVNVLINFAPSFWVQAGLSPSSQDLSSIVQQGSFLVFVIIGYLLLDSKYGGRRIQYLVGTAVMIFSAILSLIGASINNYMILFVSSLVIFGSGFQISHGLIAWSYPAELFNLRERKKVFHLFYSAQWFMQIVFTGLSTYLFGTTQKDLMILCGLFTATNIIALIFIWFYVEEVKGVPIEDVPALFEHTPRGHWPLAVKKSLNSFDKGSLDHQVVV